MPLFEDEEHVGAAIESCLAQTIADIEVIVIDDASTDGTVQVVERYVAADSRVRLIRQEVNQSAFQARKLGIEAARAPYILFLDGDDELAPTVAEKTLAVAREQSVDVVAFGCQVIKPDGSTGGDYEQSMQPRYRKLLGEDILQTLFPVGQTAQGQLWRYLFDRTLLANAYKLIDSDLVLPRANDIPIAFLAIMQAKKYVAIHEKLYRYYYRRGASGHGITTLDEYLFTAGAIDSIEAIGAAVTAEGARRADSTSLFATYESVRRSIIGRVLDYVNGIVDPDLQTEALNQLITRVGGARLVLSAADFAKSSLALLASAVDKPTLTDRDPHHILLRASNLGTGGAQGVVVAQAKHLAEAGFRVTIGIDAEPDTHFQLPDGVEVVRFGDRTFGQRVSSFLEFCREQAVDVVIDHYIFYNERWPFYVLAAAADGIPTIGWLHNFALRPIVDGTTRLTFLETYLPTLAATVVLSETDATYWRFRGLTDVLYLPNPPSPVLEHLAPRTDPRPAPDGVLEIVWWGRLQQATKQVRDLIDVASELDRLEVDYKLTIIGPDGPDLKAKELVKLAQERGVRGEVALLGALHGDALADALARAHVFVSTSVIEGYPLVFTEAQALGLPLVAYNMPWLAVLEGNEGITSVKPGDRRAIAQALAVFANEPAVYQEASLASLAAASAALSHDFATMYVDLVRGALDGYMTTDGQDDHVRTLLTMHAQYYERLLRRQNRALARAHEETESVRHDLKNSRKRIDRLERELDEAKVAQHKLAAFTKNLPIGRDGTVESLETMTPSVARTGWRGVLQKFLPTSMYQTSFYARNQHRISAAMLAQLNENQADLAHQLSQIEALLKKRKG